jgi:hypothetical protein
MKRLDIEWGGAPGPCLEETLADLERIVHIENSVLRNLWITQRYHNLSLGLAEVISDSNANWSTFATWASLTAGESIRNEEVPRFVLEALKARQRLEESLPRPMRAVLDFFGVGFVEKVASATLKDVSEQVALGNRKVFEELAPRFAHFIDTMRHSQSEEGWTRFMKSLQPGSIERGGQDLLISAFGNYRKARETPSLRAQYILLANCQIGLHEQTRLQPNIQDAMNAPLDTFFGKQLRDALPALLRPLAGVVQLLARPLVKELRGDWEKVLTRYAMNLTLPEGTEISLGEDLPQRPGGFPADLAHLTLEDLLALIRHFDENPDSIVLSGANNWADLKDRMGFIVELFRSRQQDQKLLSVPPFDECELRDLTRGRVPDDLTFRQRWLTVPAKVA